MIPVPHPDWFAQRGKPRMLRHRVIFGLQLCTNGGMSPGPMPPWKRLPMTTSAPSRRRHQDHEKDPARTKPPYAIPPTVGGNSGSQRGVSNENGESYNSPTSETMPWMGQRQAQPHPIIETRVPIVIIRINCKSCFRRSRQQSIRRPVRECENRTAALARSDGAVQRSPFS